MSFLQRFLGIVKAFINFQMLKIHAFSTDIRDRKLITIIYFNA